MKTFIYVIIAYSCAALFTELISFDLRETEWLNVLTYFWIAGTWLAIACSAPVMVVIVAYIASRLL